MMRKRFVGWGELSGRAGPEAEAHTGWTDGGGGFDQEAAFRAGGVLAGQARRALGEPGN